MQVFDTEVTSPSRKAATGRGSAAYPSRHTLQHPPSHKLQGRVPGKAVATSSRSPVAGMRLVGTGKEAMICCIPHLWVCCCCLEPLEQLL
jgi:hypothetical protein